MIVLQQQNVPNNQGKLQQLNPYDNKWGKREENALIQNNTKNNYNIIVLRKFSNKNDLVKLIMKELDFLIGMYTRIDYTYA